jgi:hypothetical protein
MKAACVCETRGIAPAAQCNGTEISACILCVCVCVGHDLVASQQATANSCWLSVQKYLLLLFDGLRNQ